MTCFFNFCWLRVYVVLIIFFFFKQKTAYEMRISDWSSDVCSSDLGYPAQAGERRPSGIMYAVVDPRAKEMALLFNGGDDLSNYRFAGPEELNSYLLSYKIANEVEV